MNQDLLEELIEKHNYIVKVTLEDENFLTVNYAGKKTETYEIFEIEQAWWLRINEEVVVSKTFVIRLYILLNIYFNCRKLKLPYLIVRYYNEDKVENLVNLVSLDLDEQETEREILLHDVAFSVLEEPERIHEFDDELEKLGMLQSFNVLKGLLI